MNSYASKKIKGFTLIEMLLVIVIIAMVLYASMAYLQQKTLQTRIDRTAAQMQQILNAGLSYYVTHGEWPPNLPCLQGTGSGCTVQYIPPNYKSPWGGVDYNAVPASDGSVFYVYTGIASHGATGAPFAIATEIAGYLPLSYVSGDTGGTPPNVSTACAATATNCEIVASVNIPGDNLNNARAVNFSGLFHNGACVPVPQCPVNPGPNPSMVPQIFVAPVSVSGLYDPGQNNVYPISSFTAYATGGPGVTNPPACTATGTQTACPTVTGVTGYWRACLQIITERGPLPSSGGTNVWGKETSVMALTRCAVVNEPAGDNFSVFTNN